MEREPNTEYILSLSYGKDSLACLAAIEKLGWPLDRIVTAEVWATDDIPADLPPMMEFKGKADKIIKERYGIEVEHICAMKDGEKVTYEKLFYHIPKRRKSKDFENKVWGFPLTRGGWCNKLKTEYLPEMTEVERERNLAGMGNNRDAVLQLMAQTQTFAEDSRKSEGIGVRATSNEPPYERFTGGNRQGSRPSRNGACRDSKREHSEKSAAKKTGARSFPTAPWNEVLRKISFGIWASPPTSLKESKDTRNPAICSLW